MKRGLLLLALTTILASGCARLDENLYNASRVSDYKFDAYQGESAFKFSNTNFDIPNTMITPIDLTSYDGQTAAKLKAVFVGEVGRIASDPTYKVILYCHGNRDHMDFYWPRVKLLANAGGKNHFGILTFDYRGYGASEGKPTEQGLYADTNAAIEWLRENGLTNDRFIIYGYSMGTAPAVELTAKPMSTLVAHRIILEAPFASAEVMVQDAALLALPGSFFTNLKIDNAEEIKRVTQPLLWLHGTSDDFLKIDTHGEVVFKNHPGINGTTKIAVRVRGADHNNVPQLFGSQSFIDYIGLVHAFVNGEAINLP